MAVAADPRVDVVLLDFTPKVEGEAVVQCTVLISADGPPWGDQYPHGQMVAHNHCWAIMRVAQDANNRLFILTVAFQHVAIATSELVAEMGSQNNAAAKVLGRISLFLENIVSDERLTELQREASRLSRQIRAIEEKIGLDDQADRLSSVLNGVQPIFQHMCLH